MSEIAIKVENLSKLFQIGNKKGTIRESISSFFNSPKSKSASEFWALKDVSFQVNKGESIGIIGRNGAGKSTLLKILSRITPPTRGRVEIFGLVSSLLEVGTGFHPELTGRENIYVNGTILGMRRAEVKNKFDEIVAFSGVEKFIDTPVKHYSSGMYVRLAFAVAAHLEPDILIIDEVLAVGDAEFQKKCMGKISKVNKEGRTVLFVSHNTQAVLNLCTRGILLNQGEIFSIGETRKVINDYINESASNILEQHWDNIKNAPGNEKIRIRKISAVPRYQNGTSGITVKTPIDIIFEFWVLEDGLDLNLSLHLFSLDGQCIFNAGAAVVSKKSGIVTGTCSIPGDFLNDGVYYISMMIVKDSSVILYNLERGVSFEVFDKRENTLWHGKWLGAVRPKLLWDFKYQELRIIDSNV